MVNDISGCTNCANPVIGNFCAICGQPVRLKRIDFHYISHEVQHQLHFEKGFLYTIKELLLRPGKGIKEFIAFNRSRLVKPIVFLIVTSLIYSTALHFFHIEEAYGNNGLEKTSATSGIFAWIQNNYGYANIIMGVFIAWWIKIFFKSYAYNLFEILMLLCFTMGMGMLIAAVVAVAEAMTKAKLMEFAGYAGVIYCTWAIGDFFDKKKAMSYVKALIAYFLGMITFTVLALLVGTLIDLLYKH